MALETRRRSDGTASIRDHTTTTGTLFLRRFTHLRGNGELHFCYRVAGWGLSPKVRLWPRLGVFSPILGGLPLLTFLTPLFELQ